MDKPRVNWDMILSLVSLFIEATGRPPEKTDFHRSNVFWAPSLQAYRSLPLIGPIADVLGVSTNEVFREIRRRSNYPCRKYERKRYQENGQFAENVDHSSNITPPNEKIAPEANESFKDNFVAKAILNIESTEKLVSVSDPTMSQSMPALKLTSAQVQKSDPYAVRPLRPKSQLARRAPIRLIRKKTI